uniref:Rieske domain-containing protein n=1 Tax=Gadus morhua TaxID=8049 RepID=A0A8C4YYI5_GADMO
MREVEVEGQKVLLVRTEGRYGAVGSRCTHYNAPLVKGALVGNRVRCPFHGACFNVMTGDIEEFPGLDCLPSYKQTGERDEQQRARGQPQHPAHRRSTHSTSACNTACCLCPGPAALLCAETLRRNSYQGRIVMVTKDALPPFDKPKLSKALNSESSQILLRSEDFFKQYGIEVWTQKEVGSVNSGPQVSYYTVTLLSPPDARARSLGCPGQHLKGVKLLQTHQDAQDIHNSCQGQRAVIIGASFIGMEVASYLSNKAASVAMVGTTQYPFERSLGPEIGKMAMHMLEENNVKFYMKDRVLEIRGEDGKVKEVVLESGAVLQADVVVAGIGVVPNSDFLMGSQVQTDSRKAVVVDEFMKTNVPDIYGAGDVTSFPLPIRGGQRVQIGHWQMAHSHGRAAALNMLNKPTKMDSVPFFWTVLLGKSIRYAGFGEGYTEIIFKGKVEEGKFLAFYIKEQVVVAAASLMFDPAVSLIAELMSSGHQITKTQAQ